MGNFIHVVESVVGTNGHGNKAPGQIFKKAINTQETIMAPLKKRMRIHTADLNKKQKRELQAVYTFSYTIEMKRSNDWYFPDFEILKNSKQCKTLVFDKN